MVWSGNQFDRPLFTGGGHTFDGLTPTNLSFYEALFNNAHNVGGAGTGNQFSETGQWFACIDVDAELDPSEQLMPGNVGAYTYGPVGELIDIAAIRDRARTAALPAVPPIHKILPDGRAAIVQVPFWVWYEPGYWVEGEASRSSSSGRMTVTVFAEPIDSSWDMREALLNHCGEGTPYVFGISDVDDPWACAWTYQHSSGWNGGPTTITGTAHWYLRWEMTFTTGFASGREPLGPDPDYYTSDSWEIELEEVLAVGSSGGERVCTGKPFPDC